ncbi:MAG: 4'-phosphopantetheinyl transferase superfamily protein [Methylococcales bacterium]|nr:4'-phosphopantetheinyl transferase superfamily protein [Methylococcales bacterium]
MDSETVEIWHGQVTAEAVHFQAYWRVLDEAEQTQAGKFKNELLCKRYVEIHGRLRNLLSRILNQPPEKIRIKKAKHGKPYLADYPELAFNLSHTADRLMIALCLDCQLGADIEKYKRRINLSGLVDKCFAEEEAAYWNQLPETKKIPEFYRFWTRKEAFVKATGHGITLGLNHCVINPENPSEFLRVPDLCGQAPAWHLLDIDLGEGIWGAMAADKKFSEVRLVDISSMLDK